MSPASQWVSLAELSILNPPPGPWLMGVLKGYFDDSGTEDDPQHTVCTVAGYVGTVESWAILENAWAQILDDHKVPYLHMKELAHFRPPFAKWRHDETGRIAFLKDLITAIEEAKFYCVGTIVRVADLKRFNQERHHAVGAYELAVYGCVLELDHYYASERTIELALVFDRCPKVLKKLATVEEYAVTDKHYPNCLQRIAMSALPKSLSFRNMPAIQVADFVAWEMRKSSENKHKWFENRSADENSEEWLYSLIRWTLEDKGHFPDERKSCSGLLGASPIEGIVLDYKALCQADDLRGGIWSSE